MPLISQRHWFTIYTPMTNDAFDISDKDNDIFLNNFRLRTKNALANAGINNQYQLDCIISNGNIFKIPCLGISGIKEVIIWSWRLRK